MGGGAVAAAQEILKAPRKLRGQLSEMMSVLLRAQRYISTRPMFIDVRELSAGAGAGSVADAAAAGIALRDLSQQYRGLLAAVKEEALIMEQVFPSPRSALAIFVQRVFEQRMQVGRAHGPFTMLQGADILLGRLLCISTPNRSNGRGLYNSLRVPVHDLGSVQYMAPCALTRSLGTASTLSL